MTEHLITGDLLARLRPGAVFLNTWRGAVVDEAALVSSTGRRSSSRWT